MTYRQTHSTWRYEARECTFSPLYQNAIINLLIQVVIQNSVKCKITLPRLSIFRQLPSAPRHPREAAHAHSTPSGSILERTRTRSTPAATPPSLPLLHGRGTKKLMGWIHTEMPLTVTNMHSFAFTPSGTSGHSTQLTSAR